MLIASAVSAIAAAVLFVFRRRRLGSREEAEAFARALAEGRAPERVDPDAWRTTLDGEARATRRTRVLLAALGALTVVFAVVSAVLNPEYAIFPSIGAVVFAVLTVVGLVVVGRHLGRVQHLRRDLL